MLGGSGSRHHTPSRRADAIAVGSEEAPIEGLASVHHSNGTCSFPAFRFHEWLCEVRTQSPLACRKGANKPHPIIPCTAAFEPVVCTENLSSGIVMMKSGQDGARPDHTHPAEPGEKR